MLVVGGGPAGIAAATAAGRAGASVVLLEQCGSFGGTATGAQVGTICGLYLRDPAGAKPTLVAGGFVAEFVSCMQRAVDREPLRLDAGLWVLPFQSGAFERVADALVSQSGKVNVVLHATVAEARTEGARLVEVGALAWNERITVRAKAVADCSGEATAAALAGADVEDGAADQVPALVFSLEHAEPSLAAANLLEIRREVRRGVIEGRLPADCERLSVVPGPGEGRGLTLKLNLPPIQPGRPAWQRITDWERGSRALVQELHRFLVKNTESCRSSRACQIAPQLGVRSGRRINGRARLADKDVLATRKQPQGIARGCWPMERWGKRPQPDMVYFDERAYYDIPLDCLRPAGLDNVLVAGRCFSAEAGAMSSARVIGTALATGWAAGTAAAFQALGRPEKEAVDAIQKQMNS